MAKNHATPGRDGLIGEIVELHNSIKDKIAERLDEFSQIGNDGTDEQILTELFFCLFTPQSKARACWAAIQKLERLDLLFNGTATQIAQQMPSVRFRNNKARYLVEARGRFHPGDQREFEGVSVREFLEKAGDVPAQREQLVKTVKGMGYKEASHFLRNIGRGESIAILDRHILRNLVRLEVIPEEPTSISKKQYLEMEKAMVKFSLEIKVPMDSLDMVLWYKEAEDIFK